MNQRPIERHNQEEQPDDATGDDEDRQQLHQFELVAGTSSEKPYRPMKAHSGRAAEYELSRIGGGTQADAPLVARHAVQSN